MSNAEQGSVRNDGEAPDEGPRRSTEQGADAIPSDDPHKAEKLTKAGREDLDPDEGSD